MTPASILEPHNFRSYAPKLVVDAVSIVFGNRQSSPVVNLVSHHATVSLVVPVLFLIWFVRVPNDPGPRSSVTAPPL
jgi:hypothetical protein